MNNIHLYTLKKPILSSRQSDKSIQPNSNKIQTSQSTSFKGYFACPLKEIYLRPYNDVRELQVIKELDSIGKLEGFKVITQMRNKVYTDQENISPADFCDTFDFNITPWSQDNTFVILDSKNQEIMVGFERKIKSDYISTLANSVGLKYKDTEWYQLQGGNIFIGQNDKKQKFALIGQESLIKVSNALRIKDEKNNIVKPLKFYDHNAKSIAARMLDIKLSQIHPVHQQEFHLDMFIRPLKYPDVLVNDPALTLKLLKKLSKSCKDPLAKGKLDFLIEREKKVIDDQNVSGKTTQKIIHDLEKAGLKPIRFPGRIGERLGINYINAIIHEKPDGSLVYITNKSDFKISEDMDINKIFEKELKRIVPKISKVYFVSGPMVQHGENYISDWIRKYQGGIHCRVAERPDFDKWA